MSTIYEIVDGGNMKTAVRFNPFDAHKGMVIECVDSQQERFEMKCTLMAVDIKYLRDYLTEELERIGEN